VSQLNAVRVNVRQARELLDWIKDNRGSNSDIDLLRNRVKPVIGEGNVTDHLSPLLSVM